MKNKRIPLTLVWMVACASWGFLFSQVDSTKTVQDTVPAVVVPPPPPPPPAEKQKEEKPPKDKKEYYWLGVRGGVVISKADFDEGNLDSDSKNKFGLDLALVFDFPVGDFLSFGPEVHWVQKGTTVEGDVPEVNFTQKLDYVHVPVLARVHLRKILGLQVFAGPSFDYLLSAKVDYEDDALEDRDNKDDFTDTTWGAVLGVGLGLGSLNFDVRYNAGFGDISDKPDTEVKSQAFGAGITLMF